MGDSPCNDINTRFKQKKKTMIGTIIYIIGLVLAIKAVLEILQMPMGMAGKVISAVLVLCTSWVGLAVYYFYAKDKLVSWFK